MIFSRGNRFRDSLSANDALSQQEQIYVFSKSPSKKSANDFVQFFKPTKRNSSSFSPPASPSSKPPPSLKKTKIVPFYSELMPGPATYYQPASLVKPTFNKVNKMHNQKKSHSAGSMRFESPSTSPSGSPHDGGLLRNHSAGHKRSEDYGLGNPLLFNQRFPPISDRLIKKWSSVTKDDFR